MTVHTHSRMVKTSEIICGDCCFTVSLLSHSMRMSQGLALSASPSAISVEHLSWG